MSIVLDFTRIGRAGAAEASCRHAMPAHSTAARCCRIGSLATGVLALSGCVPYVPKPLAPQQTASEFAQRRLDTPELRERIARLQPPSAMTWPPQALDRAALFEAMLVGNPKLAVAREQARAARTHERVATQAANPDLTLQSEYARHDVHPWLYGFALDLPLRSPGAKKAEFDLARLATSNAQWQWLDQVWAMRHSAIEALSEHESLSRRSTLLQTLAQAQTTLVAIEQNRVAAGEDAPGELLVARQAMIEIAQQQAQARADAGAAQATLAAALGLPPQALEGVALSWPDWGGPPALTAERLTPAREQALLSRSDLALAIGDYAQSEVKMQQAVARQYPQFHLSPGFYWDHGVAKFPFDVGFTPPLFNRSEIADATAEREVAGKRMLALQAQIYGEIAAAERAEAQARSSLAQAEEAVNAVREQQRQTHAALKLGAVGNEEAIAADIVALRGELELTQAHARLQTARNALEDALHAPLSGPELALSPLSRSAATEANR